ncbi:MAG: alanine:cation symporter family protein [Gammaproteobacteria bacterium]|jgi:alanine or glycine:cation symporter, AGCS family|nr:alanine:cation symporter family protein [Gammaproteobacteria bacterium]MBT4492813.1 alanine:cation symporter family protein [Gammaproteobacteria bacterium]MBT7370030.1 alanine:cation symporter family protein [Gammaproteobacteria bacterium]
MSRIEAAFIAFGDLAWGPWLLILILGGGIYFLVLSRLMPFRYLSHSIALLSGKYDDSGTGEITHFQALSSALAGTIGMGNIAGVAVAISIGGPGAVFWMWATAVLGIATKFFTCTLSVMYRGKDSEGNIQGGPMYVITEGLGKKYKPLAIFFCLAGVIGCLPLFQTNQLVQIIREVIFLEEGWITEDQVLTFNLSLGVILAMIVATVIFGGLTRIANVASRLVPSMTIIYVGTVLYVLLTNISDVPHYLWLIVEDAFTGMAAAGGAIGTVIATGVRRGAFSNEAGIGTEAMAHGAAKTDEPVREGLVAMIGPIIDTLVICTATALLILMTGAWHLDGVSGVTMTSHAFETALPGFGRYILIVCVFFFSVTTIFSYSYYGSKCLGFLIGAEHKHYYNYLIVVMTVVASILSLDAMVGLIDGAFALMAIPTMTSAIILAPKVMKAARVYFDKL